MTSRSVIPLSKRKPPPKQPWKPHGYQKQAVKFLLSRTAAGLFLDPGLGKTSITLEAIRVLRANGYGPVLVMAPLRVCHSVWNSGNERSELQRWANFEGLKSVVLHGPKKDELVKEEADIYVINYDGMAWLIKSGHLAWLMKKRKLEVLVIDELSKMKHTVTKRYKMIKKWLPKFKIRWGLTGSPASNGLLGLFGQMYTLDLGKSLGRYVTHYRQSYFMPVDHTGFLYVPQPGAETRIYESLADKVLRMSADDYLELPPLVNNVLQFELPPTVQKIYDGMEDHLLAHLDEGLVAVASNAAVAWSKCRQICSGGVYVDVLGKPRKTEHLHELKNELLEDLIDELQGQPLLIAYEFAHDLERLQKLLGKDLPYIGGGVNAKRASELEAAWNKGQLPFLAGHPASMGHGLNLQGASASQIFWYTLTVDYELFDQLVRRLRRQGTTAIRIVNHIPQARGTVESLVLAALNRKAGIQNALFDALKELRKQKLSRTKS